MINNKKKLLQTTSGLVFFGAFLVYGWLAGDIQLDMWSEGESFTARSFPYLIAIGGALASLLYGFQPAEGPSLQIDHRAWLCALIVSLLIGYSFLIDVVGYPIASSLMLAASCFFLGERRYWLIGLTSFGVVGVLYGLLQGLGIHIDAGLLRGLIE